MVNPINPNINTTPLRSNTPSGSSRPTGEPSGSKNFEKVMNRDERNSGGQGSGDDKIKKTDEDGAEVEEADESQEKPKGKPSSIFDLSGSSKQKPPAPQVPMGATVEEPPSEELLVEMAENKMLSGKDKTSKEEQFKPSVDAKSSPYDTSKDESKKISPDQASANARPSGTDPLKRDSKEGQGLADEMAEQPSKYKDVSGVDRKKSSFELSSEEIAGTKQKTRSEFLREQTDLSATDLHAQAQHQAPLVNPMGENKAAEAPRDTRQMKELIDQIVKEMYVVKTGEVTDTVITIKHPPIFEGAQVKVTSFENARGQFNIAFENLSQQAKDLLDSRVNRESLLLALNKEGYNVHIITTSTTVETPTYISEAQKKDQEQQGQGQGREQQQQQQKDQQKKKG